MALLDIQAMDPARDTTAARWEDESFGSIVCDIDVDLCL
jgi:hypothetical protein